MKCYYSVKYDIRRKEPHLSLSDVSAGYTCINSGKNDQGSSHLTKHHLGALFCK